MEDDENQLEENALHILRLIDFLVFGDRDGILLEFSPCLHLYRCCCCCYYFPAYRLYPIWNVRECVYAYVSACCYYLNSFGGVSSAHPLRTELNRTEKNRWKVLNT